MLPVTLTFAGALALVNLWLAFRIVRIRMAAKALSGDAGHPLLASRMRAQANFVEYVPFVVILMALVELAGGSVMLLRAAGVATVLARVLHAFGMDRPAPNPMRATGAVLTWLVLLGLALWAIWIGAHPPAAPAATVHYL